MLQLVLFTIHMILLMLCVAFLYLSLQPFETCAHAFTKYTIMTIFKLGMVTVNHMNCEVAEVNGSDP